MNTATRAKKLVEALLSSGRTLKDAREMINFDLKTDRVKVPFGQDFFLILAKEGDTLWWFITSKEGANAGAGKFDIYTSSSRQLQARDAKIETEFRGRGLYRQLLLHLKSMGFIIHSDDWDRLSDSARRAWTSLPNVKKTGRFPYEYTIEMAGS